VKVVHVITGLGDGGAEAVLYRLCLHDAANHHVVISLMDAGMYGPLLGEAGITVHCLNMPRGRATMRGFLRLVRLLREARSDVVQTWMYHADLLGGAAARLAGVRRVCWGVRNSTLEPGRSRHSTILVARLCAWLSRVLPSAVVCCSERGAQVHQALGYVPAKFVVIPNGYDLEHFSPNVAARAAVRQELGIEDNEPLVGMVGRYDPQKDHEGLLDALALLVRHGREFKCLLVGRGMDPENRALLRAIRVRGLDAHVRLLGLRNDIPDVMNALDVHILSSAYGEAFPNVLSEAMACGTPCVTTDVGDAAMIVGDTGWVVPPRYPEALAQALVQALEVREDATGWKQRQAACRTRIQALFGIERMVAAYRDLWGRDAKRPGDT